MDVLKFLKYMSGHEEFDELYINAASKTRLKVDVLNQNKQPGMKDPLKPIYEALGHPCITLTRSLTLFSLFAAMYINSTCCEILHSDW